MSVRKCLLVLLLITLLPLSSCSSKTPLPKLQPQWLVANDLTVAEQTQDRSSEQAVITLQTLTISGLRDRKTERSINDRLTHEAETLLKAPLPAYHGLLQQMPPAARLRERSVSVKVTGDFNHLLSVAFYRSQLYRTPQGVSFTCNDVRTLTFDLHTGRVLTLAELFPADSDYMSLLDQLTEQVITAPHFDEWPSYEIVTPFTGVTADWHFNVTPNGLRLYLDDQTPAFLLSSPRPQTIELPNAALDGSGYFAGTVYDPSRTPLSPTCQPYRQLRCLSPFGHTILQTTDEILPGCSTEIVLYQSSAWPPTIQQAIVQAAQPDAVILDNIRANLTAGKHQQYCGSGGAQHIGPYYIVYGSKRSDEYVSQFDAGPNEIHHETQTIYDAQTLQIVTLPELFISGYDYQTAFIRSLLAKVPELDEQTARALLSEATIVPEADGLRIEMDPLSAPSPYLLTFFIPYQDLGEENLVCFQ